MGRARVLLVDDDREAGEAAKACLEKTGRFEVAFEHDPVHALAVAGDIRPDVIALDIIMPDLDGVSLAFELRRDDRLRDTPLVFLNSLVGGNGMTFAGGERLDAPTLAKPIDIGEFIACVTELLE
jgi:CheY-like chemotaxis protein